MKSLVSFENCPFPVASLGAQGQVHAANAAWREVAKPDALAWNALDLLGTDNVDFADTLADVARERAASWIDIDAHVLAERRWSRCHFWTAPNESEVLTAVIPLRETRGISLSRLETDHIERILEHTADAITILREDMTFRFASGFATRWLGNSGTAYEGKNALSVVFADDHEKLINAFAACFESPMLSVKVRLRVVHESGDLIWVEAIGTNMFDDPAIQGIMVTLNDITELVETRVQAQEAQLELGREKQRYESLAQFIPTGVFELDMNNQLGYRNERFDELMGIGPTTEFSWDLFDERDRENLLTRLADAQPGTTEQVTVRLAASAGRDAKWLVIRASRQDSGYILATVDDATRQIERQAELAHMVEHDNLTGLPNRQRLLELLGEYTSAGEDIAVLFLDLDGFKDINDGLGHQVGDNVLIEVANRITTVVRPNDIVGRLHGDEFLVVCRHTIDIETARHIASRIVNAVSTPLEHASQRLFVSGSIGIAMSNNPQMPDATPEQLLVAADVAMYEAKRQGGSRSIPFSEDLGKRAADRLRLHGEVQRAGELDELELHYQPIVNLETAQIEGAEALIRWHHPTQGFILPERFIPDIEKSELIDDLGMWVVEKVIADLAERGDGALPTNVNVSPRQLAAGSFATATLALLHRYGVDGSLLNIEITELLMMESFDPVEQQLRTLQEHGVGIAVDDFGTGYSALGYLQRFPFDQIKIDGIFIDAVDTNASDRAITASIIDLASSLGATVVAEKVEREAQVATLLNLGCTYAQGYLLGRPGPR